MTPTISVTLRDGHTIVETNGWLMQDTEGRWWGMGNEYHRMLEEYQKIVIEPGLQDLAPLKRLTP